MVMRETYKKYISETNDKTNPRCGQLLVARYVNSKYTGYVKLFAKRMDMGKTWVDALCLKYILTLKHNAQLRKYKYYIKEQIMMPDAGPVQYRAQCGGLPTTRPDTASSYFYRGATIYRIPRSRLVK
tara:strand:+ start:361 stop:741 length:381 start_codon:yes stop_codon:yes gene_type:complete